MALKVGQWTVNWVKGQFPQASSPKGKIKNVTYIYIYISSITKNEGAEKIPHSSFPKGYWLVGWC